MFHQSKKVWLKFSFCCFFQCELWVPFKGTNAPFCQQRDNHWCVQPRHRPQHHQEYCLCQSWVTKPATSSRSVSSWTFDIWTFSIYRPLHLFWSSFPTNKMDVSFDHHDKESWDQFHQRSKYNFYARRSLKRKNYS